MKKIIKIMLALGVLGILTLVCINSRTPLFLPEGGRWSLGHGFSNTFDADVRIDTASIFTPEDLNAFVPNSEFLADPFFLHEKDSFYLFFEHKKYKPHNAVLAVLTSADGMHYKYKGTVLKQDFHLSYPQVFKHNGEFCMVPETKGAGNILLYTTKKFPFGWEVSDTLVKNVKLKDPSIYLSDTLNLMVASDDNLNLFLFKSDSLRGEWKRIKTIRKGSEARAGGRIFSNNGKLYLPMQNCSGGYGSALSLYEFDFSGGDISLHSVKHKMLEGQDSIPEFAYGMHHFDIQKVGKKYYYVYDGGRILNPKKTQHLKYALKLTYVDLKNSLQ